MKKLILTFLAVLALTTVSAQPGNNHPHLSGSPAPRTPSIIVESQHSETFFVYADGDLVNTTAMTQVKVENLDSREHEIIVVLQRPARKAAVVSLYAGTPATMLKVDYDARRELLSLYSDRSAAHAGPGDHRHSHEGHRPSTPSMPPAPPAPSMPVTPVVVVPQPATVSDAWVDEMVTLINSQSFDSEKLATAKGLLNNGLPFTTSQIIRIVSALTYSKSQVEFLQAAYRHCYDPENYERAIAVLTFTSDRQKVRTYISTQR